MLNLIKKYFLILALIFLPFSSVKSVGRTTDTYLQLLKKLSQIKGPDAETIINQLKELGESINVKDGRGRTPLFFAVNRGFYDTVKSLIEEGADVNAGDDYNITPLMNAARLGYEDIVKILLEAGAKVNEIDEFKGTALMHAAVNGNQNIIIQLLKKGADVALKNDQNKTAYDIAISEGRTDAANLLKDYTEYKKFLNKWRITSGAMLTGSILSVLQKQVDKGKVSQEEFNEIKKGLRPIPRDIAKSIYKQAEPTFGEWLDITKRKVS